MEEIVNPASTSGANVFVVAVVIIIGLIKAFLFVDFLNEKKKCKKHSQ